MSTVSALLLILVKGFIFQFIGPPPYPGLERMAFFAEISGAPDINYQVQEHLDWSQMHIAFVIFY